VLKKILLVLVALAVIAVIGVAVLLSNLGSLIKAAVEKFGSEATGAKVTLAEADISLTSGEGKLGGLLVGNPSGFTEANAFELGEIKVQIDTASLSGDTIIIKEVVIQGPKVRYELGATLASNLGKIQDNVDAYTKSLTGGGGAAKKPEEPKPEGGKETKLIIEHLWVRGGEVTLGTAASSTIALTSPLPEIHLTDIGKNSEGASPGEVASQVLSAIIDGALDVVTKSGIDKAAKSAIDAVGEALGGLFGEKKK
jgi:uncharacterized protein involved in outer membrane biogenesis